MLDKIKNMYSRILERIDCKNFSMFFDGLLLIILSLIAFIFDGTISTISVMYLLPIAYVCVAFYYLFISIKYKVFNEKNYITFLIGSLIFLIIPLFFVFYPISNKETFISMIGVVFVLKNVIDFIGYSNKIMIEIIKNTSFIIIGLILIIFSSYIKDMYVTLLIVLITIGIIKIILGFITKDISIKK